MITTIFFDIDGTLMDFKAAEHAAFCRAMEQHHIPEGEARYPRYSAFNRSLWDALERGNITRDELLDHRYPDFFKLEQISADPRAFERSYRKNLSEEHILKDHAIEILEYLFPKYSLHIVTNGIAATQHSRIDGAGIRKFFQNIFISEEIGFSKPDPRFFRHALSAAGNPPSENVLIIGDSLTSDMLGGFRSGLKTCWIHDEDTSKTPAHPLNYEINSLAELRKFL